MSLWETSKQRPASNALSKTKRCNMETIWNQPLWRTWLWSGNPHDLCPLPPLLTALSLVREIPHVFVESGTVVWNLTDSVKTMYQQRMSPVLVVRNELKIAHDSRYSTSDQCAFGCRCSIRLQAVVVVLYFFIHSQSRSYYSSQKAKVSFCPWFSMCVRLLTFP